MMLTRCPACQTVFRLGEDQLRARAGAVRCGHCFHPFDAAENEVAAAAPASGPKGAAAQPEAPGAQADARIAADAPTPARAGPTPAAAAAAAPEDEAGRARERSGALDFDLLEDLPDRSHGSAPAAPPAAAPAPEVIRSMRRPAPPAAAIDDFPEPRSDAGAALGAGSLPAAFGAGQPPGLALDPAAEDVDADEAGSATRTPVGEVRPAHVRLEPRSLDARYGAGKSPPGPLRRLFAGIAAGLLCSLLAAQAAYLFRMEIARDLPGLRPLLVRACAELGCEVPLPRDIALIAVEASELQSEPGRPGSYLLRVTVNNQADHVQAWPHLELTLTDGGDAPLARRVLAPAQWAAEAGAAEALAAHQVVAAHIPFRSSAPTPTGYRVHVFYP